MAFDQSEDTAVGSQPLDDAMQSTSDSEEDVGEPTVANKFAAFLATGDTNDDDEEEQEPVVGNQFDLLLGNENEDEDEDEDEEEVQPVREPSLEPAKKTATRKKQKKRKRKGKQKKEAEADEKDWAALKEVGGDDEEQQGGSIPEELFASMDDEELRASAQEIFDGVYAAYLEKKAEQERTIGEYVSVLGASLKAITVDSRLLSADSELKKLFGARVVEAERRNEEAEMAASSGRKRRGRRAHAGVRTRKNSLVTPREGWIPKAPGLCMVLDTNDDVLMKHGVKYFRYEYEGVYAKMQQEYRIAVSTFDINNIVALVSRFPCHVDGLLQLAEVFRSMGELDRAAEHIERALCVLESAWTAGFRPWNGECRLRFEVAENKSLYVGLSRYAQLLTRRGLHRTALEISKLVLGFDPDNDPMGILMVMDSLAILADENKWVWEMNESFEIVPLMHFPNFTMSAALAMFNMQNVTSSGKKGKKAKKAQEEMPKAWNEIDACKLLTDALLTFPMILRPLLTATKDSGGVWSSHKMFGEGEGYGVLNRIARIYAARAHLLWTAPKAKALLHRAAEAATRARPEQVKAGKERRTLAENWFVEKGLYRTLQVADFAEGGPELNTEVMAPENNVPVGAPEVRNVGAAEAIREFVHSLLPWRDTDDAAAAAAAAGQGDMAAALLNLRGDGNGGEGQGDDDAQR